MLNPSAFDRPCRFAFTLALAVTVFSGACNKKTGDAAGGSGVASGSAATAATPATSATPVASTAPSDQLAIAGDFYFKAADGSVKEWGFGALLPKDQEDKSKRTAVPDLAGTKRLAIGGSQTMCAAMMDGAVKCWGNGASGELGDGKESKSENKAVVVPGVKNATAVGIGDYFVCALIGDGTVQCWGTNSFHQTSVEKTDKFVTPTAMPGVTGAQQIAVGGSGACALGANGVQCWGLECGADGPNLCEKPFTVAGFAGATRVAAGWQSTCAIVKDGVQCFGSNNEYGQLGNGTTDSPTTGKLTAVKGLTGVKDLAAGQQHWCALMNDGTVQCWGSNEYGQLGDGQAPDAEKSRATPAAVKGVADAISLTCNGGACCVQVKDKSWKCWGENNSGLMFGEANSSNTAVPTPVAVSVN